MSSQPSTPDLYANDPTIDLTVPPNQPESNTPLSSTPLRYGQPLPEQWIPLYRQPMRTPTRKLRVITIGAGISAMTLAHKLQHSPALSTLLSHTIYEANPRIGGTWLVNTYPGVACDVPAHIYTFPFEPNPDWSAYYASGAEILAYFERTVAKWGLDRDVKCGHRVEGAVFDEGRGKWVVRVRNGEGVVEDECDVLVSATGFLSRWRWPEIEGLHDFGGHLCHSAVWDGEYDFRGKRVAVIGNGSSAIQIVPQLVGEVAHLTNFVRSPTYITPGLGSAVIGGQAQHVYTEEEKRRFREVPEALHEYRKKIQAGSNRSFDMFVKGSAAQKIGRQQTADMMKSRLNDDEDLARKLIPEWEVGCRRATPGPGYLESFTRDNVSLVTSSITKIEKTGVRTEDGALHPFDVIVCATGFDVSHRPPWPLIGLNGLSLSDAWKDEPTSYMSLAAAQFPNFWTFSGPNSPTGHGSLMAGLGWSADWMCQWLRKMAAEDIKYVVPKQEVVDEFNAYGDEIMQTLVWSGGCRSWYKNHRVDGKVTAVWAGSVIGYKEMVDHIRPEDFEIVYRSRNRFRFMGNGRTKREYDPHADLAFYLHK
jgi:cation diffusion facilitator CzcD-associated flavoprotein CzcO